tara:strand:+ start:1359 stop:1826 length:468 start_codon:yes stop_codon:yes gene_type:complete
MKEIERKFLVNKNALPSLDLFDHIIITQGYLLNTKEKTVRVRLSSKKAFITIKGATSRISRDEYEYQIPYDEAQTILNDFIDQKISKTRYIIPFAGKKWELDVFHNHLEGLIIAEVELENENQSIEIPSWCTEEVSQNPMYFNAQLIRSNKQSFK